AGPAVTMSTASLSAPANMEIGQPIEGSAPTALLTSLPAPTARSPVPTAATSVVPSRTSQPEYRGILRNMDPAQPMVSAPTTTPEPSSLSPAVAPISTALESPPGASQLDYRGVLRDLRTGQPLENADLVLIGTSCRTRTDSVGAFSFQECGPVA